MRTLGSCKPSQPMPARHSWCLSVPNPGAETLTEWAFLSSHSDTTPAPLPPETALAGKVSPVRTAHRSRAIPGLPSSSGKAQEQSA